MRDILIIIGLQINGETNEIKTKGIKIEINFTIVNLYIC
jgi:hypothetical protein